MAFLLLWLTPINSAQAAIEFAAFYGHRYGGTFEDGTTTDSFVIADSAFHGFLLDFDLKPGKQIEIFVSRQNSVVTSSASFVGVPQFDLSVDYYHVGGVYKLPGSRFVHPFLTGTFGLTSLNPNRSDLSSENRLSIGLGAGGKYFLTPNLGIRFDLRALYTMLNSDSAIFCYGGCTIKVRGNGFIQTDVSFAANVRF